LTALSATTAKAIVIATDGSVVLGSPGPQASTIKAKPEMMKPVIAQRAVWERVAILDPGVRGGRCMTPGWRRGRWGVVAGGGEAPGR